MEKEVKKKKILMLSDGVYLNTGFATITRKLLSYLTDLGYECHMLSHTASHQTFMPGLTFEDGEVCNYKIWGNGLQPYCQDIIQQRIREIGADYFIVLLDTFMVYPWFLNLDFAPAKTIFYYPSDGGFGMPLGCENVLRKVDKPIAMSMFAQEQVKQLYNIKADYIPHAVEPEVYKPLSEEERFQLKKKWGLDGKFVVGVVARNQGRKMLDRTLEAFARASKDIPNAVLLMHTDKNDPAGYCNFDDIIRKLNIENRVIFTGMRYFKGFNYREMNEVYNLMDVFLLGTSGEGFGVPIIEAMSCCVPVLATDYTTTWELVTRTKSGEAIKVKDEIMGTWNVKRAIMDMDDCAERLIKLSKNPTLRKEYGLNGRQAVLTDYNWQSVVKQWDKILKELN